MGTRLLQAQKRVAEIEALADELSHFVELRLGGACFQPQLATKGQQWYRATRELLAQNRFSGLKEFEECYKGTPHSASLEYLFRRMGEDPLDAGRVEYEETFLHARSLVRSLEAELLSRELPVVTQLSFSLAADEFEKAQAIFDESKGDDVLIRASGVLARVALERHLLTVVEQRRLTIIVNPPTKKKPDVEDV